jgi:hypothetical protein
MPALYKRLLASSDTPLPPATRAPDAVFVNLGTNDYSTEPHPPTDVFERGRPPPRALTDSGYADLLNFVAARYAAVPHAKAPRIFAACGPVLGTFCGSVRKVCGQHGGCAFIDMTFGFECPRDCGCDGHPNVAAQKKMADAAFGVVWPLLGGM